MKDVKSSYDEYKRYQGTALVEDPYQEVCLMKTVKVTHLNKTHCQTSNAYKRVNDLLG